MPDPGSGCEFVDQALIYTKIQNTVVTPFDTYELV
jgi:hypothetical protein